MNYFIWVKILKRPAYFFLALTTTFLVFTLAVWLPNIPLISKVLFTSVPVYEKVALLFSLYGSIQTNFSLLSVLVILAVALLSGLQIALLIFFLRKVTLNKSTLNLSALGFGGLISGLFGVGCAACGTLILTSGLTFFGATSLLTLLPLGGGEFGLLGVFLLSLSIYFLTKKITEPLVCR